MSLLQTQKKEAKTSDSHDQINLSYPWSQEKTLVYSTILENQAKIKIYPHCVCFFKARSKNLRKFKKNNPRGAITHFSKRARFRLFELIAQIDNNIDCKPLFLTLTYHHGHQNSKKSTKSQLHHFLTRLRQFDPQVQFIWRTELQSRGAPHYHIILFPSSEIVSGSDKKYEAFLAKIWHDIADPKSYKHKEYGFKSVVITSYRDACSYISKYVAKEEKSNVASIEGKHWGCSRNLPIRLNCVVTLDDFSSRIFTKTIRAWLINHGKEKYAGSEYMNIASDYTVFIDYNQLPEFWSLYNKQENFDRGNIQPLGF